MKYIKTRTLDLPETKVLRKQDEDDSWEAEAQASFSLAAESEFTRLKLELKRKAGLLPKPWYKRLLARLKLN